MLLSGGGLSGTYFAAGGLTQPTLIQTDPAINFSWGHTSPAAGVPASNYSVQWEGQFLAPSAGTYNFQTYTAGGVQLWINNTEVINDWTSHAATTDTEATGLALAAGQYVTVKMDYWNDTQATASPSTATTSPIRACCWTPRVRCRAVPSTTTRSRTTSSRTWPWAFAAAA